MRFKDERNMWHSETEDLAEALADKSASEIQEILDEHDVITLRTGERERLNIFNRLFWIAAFPILFSLFCVKWLLTGDGHLDSWAKKFKPLELVFKYSGVK